MDHNRQLRFFYLIFFGMVLLIIICFIAPFTSHIGMIIVGLITVPLLSYLLPWLMDLSSTIYTSLIYGFDQPNASYEDQFYEDDMDKAKRLVREGKWEKAVMAYRAIVQQAPNKTEPRFYLAQSYRRAGYLGLAASEYKKIADSKSELGSNHAFVLESERAIQDLEFKGPARS